MWNLTGTNEQVKQRYCGKIYTKSGVSSMMVGRTTVNRHVAVWSSAHVAPSEIARLCKALARNVQWSSFPQKKLFRNLFGPVAKLVKAAVCKTVYAGSNPAGAFIIQLILSHLR